MISIGLPNYYGFVESSVKPAKGQVLPSSFFFNSTISGFVSFLKCKKFRPLDRSVWLFFFVLQSVESALVSSKLLPPVQFASGIKYPEYSSRLPVIKRTESSGIEVVNYEAGFNRQGILTKIAQGLTNSLTSFGVPNTLSALPLGVYSDIYHIYFRFCLPVRGFRNFTMVTHIDSRMKMMQIRWLIKQNVHLICLSTETKDFIITNLKQIRFNESLISVIIPSPEISEVTRKLHIGFFSSVYRDGRKREYIIADLLNSLQPEEVDFCLMGSGLEELNALGIEKGFDIVYTSGFDKGFYQDNMKYMDLVIYTGMDEGAISVLDSLSAGVPVAITKTGFHLDLPENAAIHLYENPSQLIDIITTMNMKFTSLRTLLKVKNMEDYTVRFLNVIHPKESRYSDE